MEKAAGDKDTGKGDEMNTLIFLLLIFALLAVFVVWQAERKTK